MKLDSRTIGISILLLILVCGGVAKYRHIVAQNNTGDPTAVSTAPVNSVQVANDNKKIENETKPMAINIVKAISASWNPQEAIKRSHPSLLAELKRTGQSWPVYFKIYKKLGKLTGNIDCRATNIKDYAGPPESFTVADYVCVADYKNGHGIISIELGKNAATKDQYMMTVLRIDSPLFVKLLGQ